MEAITEKYKEHDRTKNTDFTKSSKEANSKDRENVQEIKITAKEIPTNVTTGDIRPQKPNKRIEWDDSMKRQLIQLYI